MLEFPWNHRCFYYLYLITGVAMVAPSHVNVKQHENWMLMEHKKCGISYSDRIIGGKNASMGAYPWITRIGYGNVDKAKSTEKKKVGLSYRCGGSLINELYVLTAAHCVTNLPGRFKVAGIRLGEHNTQTDPDCENDYCADRVQDFTPMKIIAHEKYNEPAFKNDIALIRLDRPVQYTSWVVPICMPSGDILEKDFVGEKAEVAGWGIYNITDPKSSVVLQTIKLPIVRTEQCKKAFKIHAEIGPEQMCVGGVVGEDSCGGDSGGPLMKVESGDMGPRYYFIGVVSFGAKFCGKTTTPAVYSRLSHYMDWILDNVEP